MKLELLIIDPQNDFVSPKGSLSVPGAEDDILRLTEMVRRLGKKINKINVTLDSHRVIDIAHPTFWVNSKGENPNPFTLISVDDVKNGIWTAKSPAYLSRCLDYVQALEANDRYQLCIWPEHCIIGTWGHCVYFDLADELAKWERKYFRNIEYVTKGSNPLTEHYSAIKADVEDPTDSSTLLNTVLINKLEQADLIAISGEALSHCVKFTVEDIANEFGEENIKKLILLEDTCSPVSGFEKQGREFVTNMVSKGMQIAKSTDFLI